MKGLDENLVVKVADFGLSRDIYERDYYSAKDKKAKLPVKWMAIESLEKGTYDTRSDVWSYGVVLWELLTRGVCPYPEVDNWDILGYLKSGRRMPQPSYCPKPLHELMQRCWATAPNERPQFQHIVDEIRSFLLSSENHRSSQRVSIGDVQYINIQIPDSSPGGADAADGTVV
ncbi:PREDICTED: hepatocyte growth factor receptor-like [Priapulus caudatus]|uniref:Hepatocyte growth factor receptor-like n=1 Tax=Priapulus caudatus TaxID=37621 RepID=A0ABM1EUX3_PRICU|nr:PREDICTED: hepatocyte growth factor receptor-like [Priapulus caudatus]